MTIRSTLDGILTAAGVGLLVVISVLCLAWPFRRRDPPARLSDDWEPQEEREAIRDWFLRRKPW